MKPTAQLRTKQDASFSRTNPANGGTVKKKIEGHSTVVDPNIFVKWGPGAKREKVAESKMF